MGKRKEINLGGVNGIGDKKLDIHSREFAVLRQKIVEASEKQTRKDRIENIVLTFKLRMQAYLDEQIGDDPISIGVFLKELLEALQIKNRRFAEYINLHPSNLSALLAGRRKLNIQLAITLSEIFNIAPELWMKIQTKNELLLNRNEMNDKKKKHSLIDLIEM